MMTDERIEEVATDYFRYKQADCLPMSFADYAEMEERLDMVDKRWVLKRIFERIEARCFPKN